MKTTLRTDITIADICDGFVYNGLEGKGFLGWAGRLDKVASWVYLTQTHKHSNRFGNLTRHTRACLA